jgi:hypothetical protein
MAALAPRPEDADKQENGADNLASTTHGLNDIPADALTFAAADRAGQEPEPARGSGVLGPGGGAAAVSWPRAGLAGLVLCPVLWLLGLDASLQGFDVGWHFLLRLAADDERDEQSADAVPV